MAAELVLDENGVWLRVPDGAADGGDRPAPRHVLAALELAARLSRPGDIEELALAFEERQAQCGLTEPLGVLNWPSS